MEVPDTEINATVDRIADDDPSQLLNSECTHNFKMNLGIEFMRRKKNSSFCDKTREMLKL